MRKLFVSLAIAIVSLFGSQTLYGCVCDPEVTPRQALREASAVFVGRVTFVETIYRKIDQDDQKMSFLPEIQINFEVQELWKGTINRTLIVRTSAGDCGFKFTLGENYLVYAYGVDVLKTTACTRTTHLASATKDLKQLGRPKNKNKQSIHL